MVAVTVAYELDDDWKTLVEDDNATQTQPLDEHVHELNNETLRVLKLFSQLSYHLHRPHHRLRN